MTHDYYLDTVESTRPTFQISYDFFMVIFTMIFIMGGLMTLREKGYIHNYHTTWMEENIEPNSN